MGIRPSAQLKLTSSFQVRRIEALRVQTGEVVLAALGINRVNDLFAPFDAFADEGNQGTVFIVATIEKGADVALIAQVRAGKTNRPSL